MTATSCLVRFGSSVCRSVQGAVAEALEGMDLSELCFVLVFPPDHLDLTDLAQVLAGELKGLPAFGCTTAGQITGKGYETDSLLIVGFPRLYFRCASSLFRGLDQLSITEIAEAAAQRVAQFRHTAGWNRLALLFVDGLSNREDILASALDTVLHEVPIFGGSAGDGLRFERTFVLHNGQFQSDAAVLVLLETALPFAELRLDHFHPIDAQVVVTRADPDKRIVYEINGAPAAAEYARLIGRREADLCPEVFCENPLLVRYKSDYYVRAIQYVLEAGALSFMAAIDEGLILSIGQSHAQLAQLRSGLDVSDRSQQAANFILGFDCVLRKLEFENKALLEQTSDILRERKVLGFNTYGEQHHGVHFNQTFVGIAFFEPQERVLF